MASILKNIKSKFIFKLVFNNIPYVRFLKIINHNKLLQKKMGITSEYYKEVSIINKIIDPSFEIDDYYEYFKINSKNNSKRKIDINEWILFSCLNSTNINIKLNITNEKFENIINSVCKINLIINIDTITFLENSNNKIKEHIYNLLIKNKNHILEITICNIELKANYIIYILHLFDIIFKNEGKYNKNNVKKFNFLAKCSKDNIKLFFDEIENIISLKNISLNINYIGLCKQHEDEINDYISKNFSNLKSLTLEKEKDFNYKKFEKENEILKEDKIIFEKFFNAMESNIQILDLSNYPLYIGILELFNNKFNLFYLKELKLKLLKDFVNENENNLNKWNFILKITDTLEVFELSIEELKLNLFEKIYLEKKFSTSNFCNIINCDNLISSLNRVKNLKKLKLNLELESEVLFKFNNFDNIEYLSIPLTTFQENMNEFFINFKNIKYLEIFNIFWNRIDKKNIKLFLPPTLTGLGLRIFNLEEINSILQLNINKLKLIKNFFVEFKYYNLKDYRQLIYYYLLYFKSLKKLSLGEIFENDLSQIFKVVPSLHELNITMKLDKDYLKLNENYFIKYYEDCTRIFR